jgi:hypothetical protein
MLNPSLWMIAAGGLSLAILAVADWYVWRLNETTFPRHPRRPQPLTGLELIDLGLSRLIATQQAVLPRTVLKRTQVASPMVSHPDDDGFKKVA